MCMAARDMEWSDKADIICSAVCISSPASHEEEETTEGPEGGGKEVVAGHYRNVLVDLEIPQASEQEVHTLRRCITVKQ